VDKNSRLRRAFTLVEVLIVVVIMAILAATIIPQFSDSSKDAKVSSMKFNLHTLRSQVELYKAQHDGSPPADLSNLTARTNAAGAVMGATDDPALFPYGPYIRVLPDNPFSTAAAGSRNAVKAASANPPGASDVTAASAGGWLYHAASGGVWLDNSEYLTE
jgi:prepilin-type N-terminal cleavage/methylation domain-containing protein